MKDETRTSESDCRLVIANVPSTVCYASMQRRNHAAASLTFTPTPWTQSTCVSLAGTLRGTGRKEGQTTYLGSLTTAIPSWTRWVGQTIENRFDYSKMDYSMMQLFLAGGRNKDDTIPSDTHL